MYSLYLYLSMITWLDSNYDFIVLLRHQVIDVMIIDKMECIYYHQLRGYTEYLFWYSVVTSNIIILIHDMKKIRKNNFLIRLIYNDVDIRTWSENPILNNIHIHVYLRYFMLCVRACTVIACYQLLYIVGDWQLVQDISLIFQVYFIR